jgi:hypothetical protein
VSVYVCGVKSIQRRANLQWKNVTSATMCSIIFRLRRLSLPSLTKDTPLSRFSAENADSKLQAPRDVFCATITFYVTVLHSLHRTFHHANCGAMNNSLKSRCGCQRANQIINSSAAKGKNIELTASGLLKLVCAKRDGGGGGVHVLMKNYGRP